MCCRFGFCRTSSKVGGSELSSVKMEALSADGKELNGHGRPAAAPLIPTKRVSLPDRWMSSCAAMSVVLLVVAVGYREWSSSTTAAQGLSFNVSVDQLKSEISPVISTAPPALTLETSDACSGNGIVELDYQTGLGVCRCHACFSGRDCSSSDTGCVVDVAQGDPTMFEKYWLHNGDSSTTEILGWQQLSYYGNSEQFFFMQTELDQVIRGLHAVVGNAVTEGRYIIVGVGSTQLLQAALYALASPSRSAPTSVVSLAPYYSAYPMQADFLKSGLYRWAGDASKFEQACEEDEYIELVTTPSNPTGEIRQAVVNGTGGALVHDLAYYWPHYVPITAPVDEELMLFTMSKNTGHAGTRIGWAVVKDLVVAQKMAKFIELNSIGVSKDSQIRATQILRSVTKAYKGRGDDIILDDERAMSEAVGVLAEKQGLFHFGASEMAYRWRRLASAVESGEGFSLTSEFDSGFCTFFKEMRTSTPAFAWLRCNQEEDCENFLRLHGIRARSGTLFGAEPSFVRISMVDRRSSFEILVHRLESLAKL